LPKFKSFLYLLFTFLFFNSSFSQTTYLKFDVLFEQESLELNKNYTSDSIQFTKLQFYISNLTFLKDNIEVQSFDSIFYLVDITKNNELNFNLDYDFTHLSFDLGIDSMTNVSGAFGDNLDPIHGMYWTWQSGYINFKIEGISPVCKTRKNQFQFHLGGYQFPFNCIQSVKLEVHSNKDIVVLLNLEKWMNEIDLSNSSSLMSPSELSVRLSATLSNSFIIK
jgi:hypothetical protein